jgi:hypothetical protein
MGLLQQGVYVIVQLQAAPTVVVHVLWALHAVGTSLPYCQQAHVTRGC